MSLLALLGLPNEIGIILFLAAIGAILAPFLGGLEMGTITIPQVLEKQRSTVTLIGVLGILLSLSLFYPFFSVVSPKSINGDWLMIDTVDESGAAQYIGTAHRFALILKVNAATIEGVAEKTSYAPMTSAEPPRNVEGLEKSQLHIKGQLSGNTLLATFEEIGAQRTSNGKLLWRFSEDFQEFTGSFASTAARAKGRCYGIKLP